MSRLVKTSLAAAALLALAAVGYWQRAELRELWRTADEPAIPAVSYEEVKSNPPEPEPGPPPVEIPEPTPIVTRDEEPPPPSVPTPGNPVPELPSSFNLAVPFTPQAPFANWDDVHEETCEEASVYMVHLYYQGVKAGLVDPEAAEGELLRMVEREQELFGYFEDTTAEETARFVKDFYGYARVDLLENPTVDDLKRHLAAGHPIVAPVAGQYIGNPYFTPPGPDYHMLVIRGYTPDSFITNDPGTKRGEGFRYSHDVLMNAIHDWNPPNDILQGRKVVLVIYPN